MFKYMATYIVIAVFVVGVLMPMYLAVLKNEKRNKIRETYMHLENASYEFQNQIKKTNSFLHNLRKNRDIVKLSLIADDGEGKNLYLLNVMDYFTDTLFHNEMESEIILQFPKNSILLTPGRIFDQKEVFYQKFFRYGNMSYPEWQKKLNLEKQFIWKSRNIIQPNQSQYAAFTINQYYPSSSSPTMIASIVIPEEYIWDLVMTDEVEKYGFVYLADMDSNIIASRHYTGKPLLFQEPIRAAGLGQEKYTVFTIKNLDFGLEIVAGIPDSVYEQAVVPIKKIIIVYTIAALVIASAFSVLFAYRNYSPLKSIAIFIDSLRGKSMENKPVEGEVANKKKDRPDIYDYIKSTITDISSSKEDLKQALEAMKHTYKMKLFRDTVCGNALSQNDKNTLLEGQDALQGDYILVMIAMDDCEKENTENSEETVKLRNREDYEIALEKIIVDKFRDVCIYHMDSLCAILNVRENGGSESVRNQLRNISKVLKDTVDWDVFFGISLIHSGIEEISIAYNEALNCIALVKSAAENRIMSYDEMPPADSDSIGLSDYYLLFNYLMVGDQEGVIKFFDDVSSKLHSNPCLSPKRFRMIYYNIVSVLSSVTEKLPEDSNIQVKVEYDTETERDKLINQLFETSIQICKVIEKEKDKQKLKLREEVLDYLSANFNQPDLCLAMIAEKFHISESYASQFIKEQTGKNYTQHVEELRMKEAQRLLKETDLPISRIAEMVGYCNKNTFYKSFKKVCEISPKTYRESFQSFKDPEE